MRLLLLLICACDNQSQPPVEPADLKAITYNMYYGLSAELVPEDLSRGSLSATATAILNAVTLTNFQCRVQGAAQVIVAEKPDVIGLQEALLLSFARDLDDPTDDEVLLDFNAQLIQAIQDAGGPKYQAFVRQNATIQDSLPLFGGIRIADRSAILVSPKYPARLAGSLTYANLEPAGDFAPGTSGVVTRGALHVEVPFSSGARLDLFNTHLQSGGDVAVRTAQAQELAAWIQANSGAGSTIVLTGDLNDVPNSAAVMTFADFLTDTYALVGTPPGFTAYQPQTLDNPDDEATMRIDFIFTNSPAVVESRVIFNTKVPDCDLWTSDHFGVVSSFKTVASPPPGPP